MSSRRQVRLPGGGFTSHLIRRPQRVSVVAPIPKPVPAAPIENAPAQTGGRKAKAKTVAVAVAEPAAPATALPVAPVAEMNHIDKANSKARRAEVLKTINDALTGKLKAKKQRGGLLRVLN